MSFNPVKFSKAAACVLGIGKSGAECAKLLRARGFNVLASDAGQPAAARLDQLLQLGVEVECGGHSEKVLHRGFVVKSPGIASTTDILRRLNKAGIPVFSETEVALAFCPECRIFAVTGTNGKTTTTGLLGCILEKEAEALALKPQVHVCGNIGLPVSAVALKAKRGDFIALEMSSYQLEDSAHFRPEAAAVLNITPDHLEHHGGMKDYIAAKRRIFSNQSASDLCVFNAEDAACRELAQGCPSEILFFSSAEGKSGNAFYRAGLINFSLRGSSFKIKPPVLPGLHNIENAMAAGLMALGRGVPASRVEAAFAEFKGIEHRIEDVAVFNGVRFINDSKATNVDSTLVALKALAGGQRNIWLILGGLDKGAPYLPLAGLVRQSVKTVLTIGSAAPKIEKELAGTAAILSCENLENAVKTCLKSAAEGDILLLSPACASYDQYSDFEARGRHFKKLVRELGGGF